MTDCRTCGGARQITEADPLSAGSGSHIIDCPDCPPDPLPPDSAIVADSDGEMEEALAEMRDLDDGGYEFSACLRRANEVPVGHLVAGLNFERPSTYYQVTEVVDVTQYPTHGGYGYGDLPPGQFLVRVTGRMVDGLCTRYYAPTDRVLTMRPAEARELNAEARENAPGPIDPREYL